MTRSPLFASFPRRTGSALLLSLLIPMAFGAGLGDVNSVWQFENDLAESNGGPDLVPISLTPAYPSATIAGDSAAVLDLVPLSSTQWLQMPNGVGGNGGSLLGRTNEWTLAMDLYFAVLSNDVALLQTSTTNADDAEIHVTSNGAIDLGGIVIADPGTVQAGQWHRIVFSSEVIAGDLELKAYVDGSQTEVSGNPHSLSKPFDGNYSLPATVPLFADDNSETLALKLNSLSFWDSPLTSTEIGALEVPTTPGLPDLYVTNNGNSGAGSLRAALSSVRDGGSVYFDLGMSGQTITLGTGGQLELSAKALDVEARHLASKPAIDGVDSHRIFNVLSTATVTLRGLIMTNGNHTQGGGAVRNQGTMTIIECNILSSDASSLEGSGVGGGILNDSSGTITIVDSTIDDNVSDAAAGMFNAGVATLRRCTISGNRASTVGGIENINVITMINCTVSGNSAISGGGGGLATLGSMTLISCTVSNNLAGDFLAGGGGVLVDFTAILNLENSIVAGNTSVVSGEENIGSDGFALGTVNYTGLNVTSGDPKLEPLDDYGGLTETMPPQIDSSAAAKGLPTGKTPTLDQRGFPRVSNLLDIGSTETPFDVSSTIFTAWAVNNIPLGQDRSFAGDPDGDLMGSGLEYALLTNPSLFDSLSQPLVYPFPPTGLVRDLRMTIPFNTDATDIVYVVEEANDLNNWTEIYRYNVLTATETVSGSGLTTEVNFGNQTITIIDDVIYPFNTFWRMGVILTP